MLCEISPLIGKQCFGLRVGKPETVQPSGKFGNWLYKERKSRGLEKKQLAARAGVGQSSITQIEGGVRHPSRKMVHKLVNGLRGSNENEDALLYAGMQAAGFIAAQDDDQLLLHLMKTDPVEAARQLLERAKRQTPSGRASAPASEFDIKPAQIGERLPAVKFPEEHSGLAPAEEDREHQRRN